MGTGQLTFVTVQSVQQGDVPVLARVDDLDRPLADFVRRANAIEVPSTHVVTPMSLRDCFRLDRQLAEPDSHLLGHSAIPRRTSCS